PVEQVVVRGGAGRGVPGQRDRAGVHARGAQRVGRGGRHALRGAGAGRVREAERPGVDRADVGDRLVGGLEAPGAAGGEAVRDGQGRFGNEAAGEGRGTRRDGGRGLVV